jgi:diguanylate cyclase (GGDEF)-like protein
MSAILNLLQRTWSSSVFDSEDMTVFAQPEIHREAEHGIFALGMLTMLVMSGLSLLYYERGLGAQHVYTFLVLALLAVHVAASAKAVTDTQALYLLGMVLLTLCGLAFVLLAHRFGMYSPSMFSTVVLLFMAVPLVSWGMREALAATGILYVIFTASAFSAASRFTPETQWTLQFLMISSTIIALALVARTIVVSKARLEAQFLLTASNTELSRLSNQDALTGAWNRRFLEDHFDIFVSQAVASGRDFCLGVVDVDKFKELNDAHGHDCGDRVLQWLVKVLTRTLHKDEYVVRMGGDEFVLLMKGHDVGLRLERALAGLKGSAQGCPAPAAMPGLSIGLARVRTGTPVSFHEVYVVADHALYAAKAQDPGSLIEIDFDAQRVA